MDDTWSTFVIVDSVILTQERLVIRISSTALEERGVEDVVVQAHSNYQ